MRASLKLGIPIIAVHGNNTGDFDLVCHSHSHTAHVGMQIDFNGGHCRLVNPGSVAGIDAPSVDADPTWILADLEQMSFEMRTLQNCEAKERCQWWHCQ